MILTYITKKNKRYFSPRYSHRSREGIKYLLFIFLVLNGFAFSINANSETPTEYRLYTVPGESTTMHVLRILPNGQFVNPDEHYSILQAPCSVRQTHKKDKLIIGGVGGTKVYRINSDGSLTFLSQNDATSYGFSYPITPNDEFVLPIPAVGSAYVFRLTAAGELISTGYQYDVGLWSDINPRNNPVFAEISPVSAAVYWLDYTTGSISQVTTILTGNGTNGFSFTLDGSLGLLWGVKAAPDNDDQVVVLAIDTAGSVTTTSQSLLSTNELAQIYDLRIAPDGKYAFIGTSSNSPHDACRVVTIMIDTVTGIVTDTGIRSSAPTSTSLDILSLRISDDGRLLVAYYWDDAFWSKCLATAYINSDGTITWTGYTFPYDTTFCTGLDFMEDMEIISIYAPTAVESQWQLYN